MKLVFHSQRTFGPVTYADRELFGYRMRSVWVFGRLVAKWRVR